MVDDRDDRAFLALPIAGQPIMPRMHRQALAELVRGVLAGEAFVALTGKPGVGKTAVLNTAIAVLGERNLRVRRIGNPTRSPLHLQQMMGQILGNPAATVTDEDIERLFDTITSHSDQDHLVLVFDDAQYLQADVLGYFQIVSRLHALGIRHQQVIFTARPEFWGLLEDPKLHDLAERIRVRPVIGRLCEAEALDYLSYRIEQIFGANGQLVPDAALNAIIDHGDGIAGRLDFILTQSLAAAKGGREELRPDTVHAVAQAVAKLDSSVALPTVAEAASGQIVPPLASRTSIYDAPQRRHPVLYPGAFVCIAALLVGGIGTAAWRSSVLSNSWEINRPTTFAPILLREPRVRMAGQPITGVTTDSSMSVVAEKHEGATAAESLPTAVTTGSDASSGRAGIASPPFRSSPSPASPVQWARLQSAPVAPTASPQVLVSASLATTFGGAAQPSSTSTALATAPSAPVPPASIAATAPSILSPTASPAPATRPKEAVSAPTTAPTDEVAQQPKTPPSSAKTLSTAISPLSPKAVEPTPMRYAHPASATGPQGPVLPASTEAGVTDTHRYILPNSVATPRAAETWSSNIEVTAPGAPVSRVLAIPAPPGTSAAAPAAIPALAGPSSPRPKTAPADSEAPQISAPLSPEIVADLLRRGDTMLAIGDISAARLLYRRAADSGDARATTQFGETYDPAFLVGIGAWSVPSDATTAAKLYRKAIALGDVEATERLKRLGEAGQ